jgi:hypothetical protein
MYAPHLSYLLFGNAVSLTCTLLLFGVKLRVIEEVEGAWSCLRIMPHPTQPLGSATIILVTMDMDSLVHPAPVDERYHCRYARKLIRF